MARIDNLTNFLTDISAIIKNKKGSIESISAKDFDTEIEEIVELAKEDYNILDKDGIHLSTKYTNWQEDISKEENEIIHVPAGISPEKIYTPLDSSYKFTQIKINYGEIKIPKQPVKERCYFHPAVEDERNEIEIWTTDSNISISVQFAIDHHTYWSRAYVFYYDWNNATQSYQLSNSIREQYYQSYGGITSSNSNLTGANDTRLVNTIPVEVYCKDTTNWNPMYANFIQVFTNPIIPAETYICKDEEWTNVKDTISADKYADGNEVFY